MTQPVSLALSIVVDVSGSMEGEPLNLVKESLNSFPGISTYATAFHHNLLQHRKTVLLMTFMDAAGKAMFLGHANAAHRRATNPGRWTTEGCHELQRHVTAYKAASLPGAQTAAVWVLTEATRTFGLWTSRRSVNGCAPVAPIPATVFTFGYGEPQRGISTTARTLLKGRTTVQQPLTMKEISLTPLAAFCQWQ